ncbi:thiamine biosynthesis protein ApbE [Pollutimonas subterranea]|uniref:FAD:protein FMN transferase n=1 Tax=Pollutimonas subterranea TaxID=2045210 RepID=A0A2N4U7S8_9BURK|nr:FAD:protein FMN transferase [Pollutimonas subterranea]PLC51081.1 thiamine biosynthesis protein ApbE [Pollutimonas subterranea]
MKNLSSRRRFIGILAAATGSLLVPGALRGALAHSPPAPPLTSWRGIALGADAELHIYHPDAEIARRLIDQSVAEVHRLEKIFSLYQDGSVLSILNRQGFLDTPPADLLNLLSTSRHFSMVTGGAFDPSVQPLWTLYADHFSQAHADPGGPSRAAIERVLALVDHESIEIGADRIRLLRPGMALTLNGIAQGYITDRVTQLLRKAGLDRALVDMGEIQAMDRHEHALPWRVGLADPEHPEQVFETVSIRNHALATSGGYGTHLDAAGRFAHIFDPGTGSSQARYRSVSVLASNATTADALSTGLSNMPLPDAESLIRTMGVKAWFILADGSRVVLEG